MVFSGTPLAATDIWTAALLFYNAPGYFAEGNSANVPVEELELCFRNAIERRCGTVNTRKKVAGFVIAFVAHAVYARRKFRGKLALFAVVPFLQSLVHRGATVAPHARWALKVFDDALSLGIPLSHPVVLNVVRRGESGPKTGKLAPMLTLEALRAIDDACGDESLPFGMRLYFALIMALALAALRFGDTKVVYVVWASSSAFCGQSRGLKKKVRPIFTRAAPLSGLQGKTTWASVGEKHWYSCPPLKGGYRALFPHVDACRNVDDNRSASYHVVLRMFRMLRTVLGFENPKWTLHPPVPSSPLVPTSLAGVRRTDERWGTGPLGP